MKPTLAIVVAFALSTGNTALAQPLVERAAGQFEPGYLGVFAQDGGDSVEILSVVPGGPADRAGVLPGDRLHGITNRVVRNMEDLHRLLSTQGVGSDLILQIEREALPREVRGRLGSPPVARQPLAADVPTEAVPPPHAPEFAERQILLGVRTVPVSAAAEERLMLPTSRGALVTEVRSESPAEAAGIPVDALIVAVNGIAVGSPADLVSLVSRAGYGSELTVTFFWRDQTLTREVTLTPSPRMFEDDSPAYERPQADLQARARGARNRRTDPAPFAAQRVAQEQPVATQPAATTQQNQQPAVNQQRAGNQQPAANQQPATQEQSPADPQPEMRNDRGERDVPPQDPSIMPRIEARPGIQARIQELEGEIAGVMQRNVQLTSYAQSLEQRIAQLEMAAQTSQQRMNQLEQVVRQLMLQAR